MERWKGRIRKNKKKREKEDKYGVESRRKREEEGR